MKKTPNPIDKHIGSRVRLRRLMLKMSQEKLGDMLGLTFQQVQKYEKGTNRIGGSRMQQLSTILTVPVAFFFEGAPIHAGKPAEPDNDMARLNGFLANREGLEIAGLLQDLDDRHLISTLARFLRAIKDNKGAPIEKGR